MSSNIAPFLLVSVLLVSCCVSAFRFLSILVLNLLMTAFCPPHNYHAILISQTPSLFSHCVFLFRSSSYVFSFLFSSLLLGLCLQMTLLNRTRNYHAILTLLTVSLLSSFVVRFPSSYTFSFFSPSLLLYLCLQMTVLHRTHYYHAILISQTASFCLLHSLLLHSMAFLFFFQDVFSI